VKGRRCPADGAGATTKDDLGLSRDHIAVLLPIKVLHHEDRSATDDDLGASFDLELSVAVEAEQAGQGTYQVFHSQGSLVD
jgi:hypothetical protein